MSALLRAVLLGLGAFVIEPAHLEAQILSRSAIGAIDPLLQQVLSAGDRFGSAVVALGDLDEDGFADLAVGARGDDDGGTDRGAVYVLFGDASGGFARFRKVSALSPPLAGQLSDRDGFGSALAVLGDLGGDGTLDIAVGAPGDDGGGANRGAIWILQLERGGSALSAVRLSALTTPALSGLQGGDSFGSALAAFPLEASGRALLVIGAPGTDAGATNSGGFWLAILSAGAVVDRATRIDNKSVGLTGVLEAQVALGTSVAILSAADEAVRVAAGAPGDDTGASNAGAVWILSANVDGEVVSRRKIARADIGAPLSHQEEFGAALAFIPSQAGSAAGELAIGAPGADEPFDNVGAVWIVSPDSGTATPPIRLAALLDDPPGAAGDAFGESLYGQLDIDRDGVLDLVVAAPGAERPGGPQGAGVVWFFRRDLPPHLSTPETTPSVAAVGQAIQVALTAVDNQSVASLQIHFRRAGDTVFLSGPMTEVGVSRFVAQIPEIFAEQRGLEYFVTAIDNSGLSSRSPRSGHYSVPLRFVDRGLLAGGAQPASSDPTGYRLVSIPLELDDPSPGTVLEDDLGPLDPSNWRLFDVGPSGPSVEYPDSRDFQPGRALLLIVREPGKTISSGPGRTVRTDRPFPIPLSPGWNVFGNPFNFSIPLRSLALAGGGPMPDIRFYFGKWNNPVTEPVVQIEPFAGYAIFNAGQDEDTLLVDPNLGSNQGSLPAEVPDRPAAHWHISVEARSVSSVDGDNTAVVRDGASPGRDTFDAPEPMSLGQSIQLSFVSPASGGPSRLSTDARPPDSDGTEWQLALQAPPRVPVVLRFDGLESVPPDFDVRLYDPQSHAAYDLRHAEFITVPAAEHGERRVLHLMAGRQLETIGRLAVPDDRVFQFDVFPNPTASSASVTYRLEQPLRIRMGVYDVLGRLVVQLRDDDLMPAGTHLEHWSGTLPGRSRPSPGVYLVRLDGGGRSATRTLVIR